ncbi:MAG: DNA mismatch repair protein MutS [Haloquadratum walsbyi J07HQW1]|uniref:DNA mismatch repair protein MutS n=1 Tax=Haloquadratum walsbyi J07HQW1 TaxID=1238424 RepID=U1PF47_9EURY|nr:MAG: DNA mismatch repair protein MutS [Haloquadratum walsbyi J07HQW1]
MASQGIVEEFLSLRAETDADLLTMQCGDFYEFFAEDAELVSTELDLTISQKSAHGSSYPMAGVPVDDLTPYLKSLVERGYRVAVADQHESDDGDHYRRISRVVTPGTLLATDDADARYIAAVVGDLTTTETTETTETSIGIAFAEVTTGSFFIGDVEDVETAYAELTRFDPVEILPGPTVRNADEFIRRLREDTDATVASFETAAFALGRARHILSEQFGTTAIDSVNIETDVAIQAAGAILAYIDETDTGVRAAITRLQPLDSETHLALDTTTRRNLELTETMHGDRGGDGTLLGTIDHTATSAGQRQLREWIMRPQREQTEITRRLNCVEALVDAPLARERINEALNGSYDLERLAARCISERADATDLLRIRETLDVLPTLNEVITESTLSDSPLTQVVTRPTEDTVRAVRDELIAALVDDPPKTIRDGGLFQYGYDDELDSLRERHETAQEWMDTLAKRETETHDLNHLSVDRNKTDGHYIQVGKSVADQVPEHYREIKTLKNSKRFKTDELVEREREILRLEESRGEIEYELFCELREQIADYATMLQTVGQVIAEIDALYSLATHAVENDWTRPTLCSDHTVDIEAGRHPVVEQTTEFVPNDLRLGDERNFLLVTGPNMSGKSTYLRQVALITLLAHAGSFIPAAAATIGSVDGIYTRVGALDELAQGRSTFMVEMQELSKILHSASSESLVILDEVGRGTATYDGISIAWAATEYLSAARPTAPSPRVLFATHYHELTTLADRITGVSNVHVAAEERHGDVTFLRTVEPGPADRSYGIHVAELAGVPDPVVTRARDVLSTLRADEAIEVETQNRADTSNRDQQKRTTGGANSEETTQQVVFDVNTGDIRVAGTDTDTDTDADADTESQTAPINDNKGSEQTTVDADTKEVINDLQSLDIESTAPVTLLQTVEQWQEKLTNTNAEE